MNVIDLHPEVWEQLQARRQRMPHALLLAGQRGIGKFDLACELIASLFCEDHREGQPACRQCLACRWLALGNHPDLRLVQPEAYSADNSAPAMDEAGSSKKTPSQQITINQIRDLDDFLHVGTHRHGARIVLINPAEAMNRATANALLKSLEEPVAGTLFILINSEPHLLLPTIRSRCQRIFIRPPSFATAVSWLQHAGLGVHAERWLALAGGSPLLALELANSQESEILETLIPCLIQTETFDPLQAAFTIDRVIKADKSGHRLQRTLEWAQKWLFDLALVSYGMSPRYFLEHCLLMQRLVRATDARRLLAFGRKALQYRDQCRQPLNSRLFLEDFFLDYARIFRNS